MEGISTFNNINNESSDNIINCVAHSHKKKFSFPIFYDDELLKIIFNTYNSKTNEKLSDYSFFILKYSGLFEYAFDKNFDFVLGIKNEYDNKSIDELFKITMENLKKYKEKDVDILNKDIYPKNKYLKTITESEIIKTINSKDTKDLDNLKKTLQLVIESFENLGFNDHDLKCSKKFMICFMNTYSYSILNTNLKEFDDVHLFLYYINYIELLKEFSDKFVKFADKTYLKPSDFLDLKKNIETELIKRTGKEKFDTIIKNTNNKSDEECIKILKEYLIEKINIDDEIRDIENRKSKLKETDIEYKSLNQRLQKLLLYKERFNLKDVIKGEGPVFSNYYGFTFGDIVVFDCFFDDDDVLKKAKKEYGNRVYLLTLEDYVKVKDLNSKTEINEYINNNLKPCAGSVYHGGNYEEKLLNKIELIKKCIEKKNYILDLSKIDNPVTDEEIKLTKEEFDYYVSKYISSDEETMKRLENKSRLFESQREKNIRIIEEKKEENEIIKDLSVDDRVVLNEEIDETIDIIDKVNKEKIDKGLTPLSLENTDFIELYMAYLNYLDNHKIERRTKRDPLVAIETKRRTYYDGYFHCELCGKEDSDSLFFDSHHFIPISENGPDDIYNTVCLCLDCHRSIHNNRVTNFQNYMLIQKIKSHIMLRTPELLPKFEKTLSFKENRYLESIDQIDENIKLIEDEIEETYDKDLQSEELLSIENELEKKIEELVKKKQKLINLANKIQNYYIFDNEHEVSKKENSDKELKLENK